MSDEASKAGTALRNAEPAPSEPMTGPKHAVRQVPPPPIVPVIEPATFGFVENAERQNSRASMIGWWSLLLVEAVAGKGLLEIAGFEVGKGINFTF